MKKVLLFLSVATVLLFTSCEKDAEPSALAIDLQNGFWELKSEFPILKFDGTNVTFYNICEEDICSPDPDFPFPCTEESSSLAYVFEGNIIYLILPSGDATDSIPIKIEGDILNLDNVIYQRKETLLYKDCN